MQTIVIEPPQPVSIQDFAHCLPPAHSRTRARQRPPRSGPADWASWNTATNWTFTGVLTALDDVHSQRQYHDHAGRQPSRELSHPVARARPIALNPGTPSTSTPTVLTKMDDYASLTMTTPLAGPCAVNVISTLGCARGRPIAAVMTYTGATTIYAGTLHLGNGGSTDALVNSTVTVKATRFNDGSLTLGTLHLSDRLASSTFKRAARGRGRQRKVVNCGRRPALPARGRSTSKKRPGR